MACARRRRRAPPRRHRPRRRRLDVAGDRRARATGARAPRWPRATGRSCSAGASSCRPPDAGRRRWITFDGIFYQADVWLDGAYLGDPEGYFFPHSFDVTALSRLGDDHVLAVEVTCNPESGTTRPAQHHRPVPALRGRRPGLEPGRHLAAGARLRHRARSSSTGCASCAADADDTRAHLRLHARLDSDAARTRARAHVGRRRRRRRDRAPAGGRRQRDRLVARRRPAAAVVAAGPRRAAAHRDRRRRCSSTASSATSASRRTGLREVAWNDWVCSINGERLFLKGANLLPTRPGSPTPRPPTCAATSSWRSRPGSTCCACRPTSPTTSCTGAADELGMLLLQDFPLQWGYARADPQGGRAPGPRGRRLARPPPVDRAVVRPRRADRRGAAGRDRPPVEALAPLRRPAAADVEQVRPRPLGQALVRAGRPDPPDGRPRRRRAAPARGSTAPTRTCGSGGTAARSASWPSWPGSMPRLVRFVSEFGAQSVPDRAASSSTRRAGRELDWEALREHHGLEVEVMAAAHPARRAPHVRRVAHGDAAQPGVDPAPPHRDAAPAEVPARPAGSASRGSPTRRR